MTPDDQVPAACTAALADSKGLVSAYLFGSVAEGRAHRESDIDVGVLLDRAHFPDQTARFEARLRLIGTLEAAIGRPVDLVILNDAPPHLARHVMTRGRRLLVVDRHLDHAHLRTVCSRAADLEPFLRRMRAIKLEVLTR